MHIDLHTWPTFNLNTQYPPVKLHVYVIYGKAVPGNFMLFLLTEHDPCFFFSESTDRIDDLDIRVKQFFMNCRKAKPEWKEQQYKQIRDVSA